ncbi:DUF4247 domain-containing protein [Bacillus sp. DJP31]|uniref:DUF4247 domain-containing protein n=1 Tax=Bacillus sp. DJP31 TaxID=3409789 RepID=UPI003BB4D177
MRRLFFLVILLALLSACGTDRGISGGTGKGEVLDYIQATYPLVDVVKSSSDQRDVTRIFNAEGSSIEEVTSKIQSGIKSEPVEVSERTNEKQVIVYDDFFVTMTTDPENKENTLVEVATYGFVRDNYQPSFFNGLMAGYLLSSLLDVDDWGRKQNSRCLNSPGGCYGGYIGSGKGYKGPVGQPFLRGGSSSVRGGGPGTGK